MNRKEFPIIYKYSKTGACQQWQIVVDGNKFYTIAGQTGGKLTSSLPTVCIGKNIGKKNETSPEQQALAEAEAKHYDKIEKGHYNETLTEKKNYFEPMLAHVLEDYEKLLFTVDTYIQPKLDGLCMISQNDTEMSRNGKPYLAVPHLHQHDTILHGELYNHKFKEDFNKIVSLCKKQNPSKEELAESKELVQYWIYDFPSFKGKFSDRYEALRKWLVKNPNDSYVLTPTYRVKTREEIDKRNEEFLAAGFEGSIIRLDLGEYENKRSKQVLKMKKWMDEEFQILSAEEGTGGRVGTIGKFHIKLPNGNSCKSNVKGNFDFLRDVWKDREKYIGTQATVKFFGYTPDGAVRFPYVIKLNRQEYE